MDVDKLARARQPTHHRTDRNFEQFGSLAIGLAIEDDSGEHGPQFCGHDGHRRADDIEFRAELQPREFILAGKVINLVDPHSHAPDALGPQPVEVEVGCNLEHPILQTRAGLPLTKPAQGPFECGLQQVVAHNDTYYIDDADDVVQELAGEGTDAVVSGIDYALDDAGNVENIRLAGNAHSATGNSGDNALTGAGGADTLSGGDGNDMLDGGNGADLMIGGAGDDTFTIDNSGDVVVEDATGGNDTVVVSTDWTLADNIENVTLQGSGHRLTGNAADNTLKGDTGSDTLDGGAGDDLEEGGDGNDTLVSTSGNDRLIGGAGDDVYKIHGGSAHIEDFQGHDTLDASEAEGDSIIDLSGETQTQVEGREVYYGSGGTVTGALNVQFLQDLTGSFGDDIANVRLLVLQIVAALDSVSGGAAFGVSSFRDKAYASFGGAGDYVYQTNLAIGATAATLTGTYAGFVATGGADLPEAQLEALLQTAMRASTEVGYQSNSARFVVLFTDAPFHTAADGTSAGILAANNGNAIINDGGILENYPEFAQLGQALAAANLIPIFAVTPGLESSYQGLSDALGRGTVVTLSANSSNIVSAITTGLTAATTTHIADAVGGAGNDALTGNTMDNMLSAGAGNDLLDGRDGKDHLVGGAGDDKLTGGAGDDVLDGGDGTDTAVLGGARGDYTIVATAGGYIVTDKRAGSPDGADTLIAVENVQFIDGMLVLGTNQTPVLVDALVDQSGAQGSAFSFTVPAGSFADLDATDTLTYAVTLADGSPLPGWLSFDAATLTFSGTPANGDVGLISVQVTASDTSLASVSDVFDIAVANANDAPVVAVPLGAQATAQDIPFSYTIPANAIIDVDVGDSLNFVATLANGDPLPAWLSFDSASMTFSGTPASGDLGSLSVQVTATDGSAASVATLFNLTVTPPNTAPGLMTPLENQAIDQGSLLSFAVPVGTFVDPDASDLLTYSATLADGGALPAWLSFDAAAQSFSGTPVNGDVGTISVKVTATDPSHATVSDTLEITVNNINDAPVVVHAIADQSATQDTGFTFAVAADSFADPDAGDVLTYAATLTDGSPLPGWLSFDALTQTFSGTPANGDVGTIAVQVTATDGALASASKVFILAVANTNDAPTLAAPLADQAISQGATLSYVVPNGAFADVDAGDVLTYSASLESGAPLPGWLSFDPATHRLSGTPANGDVGTYAVLVTVTDSAGATASDLLSISLANVNDAPLVITPLADQSASQGGAFNFAVPAGSFSDIDVGDMISYSATLGNGTPLPGWVTFDTTTMTFSGTPANGDVGTIAVRIIATDASGATASDLFNIAVANVNDAPVITGPFAGSVTEDATQLATGQLIASDPDIGATAAWSIVGATSDIYGVFGLSATGQWTYTLNNAAAQALTSADHIVQTYTVKVDDGQGGVDTHSIAITINGADEIAVTTITGTAGNDTLTGTAGDDNIFGLGGSDTVRGGDGRDVIDGGLGNDTLDGGNGIDTSSYASATSAVNVSLASGKVSGGAGGDSLTNFENVTGSNFNDGLTGNSGVNTLQGGAGNDSISGGTGADSLYGGIGADSFVLTALGDTLLAARDTVFDFSHLQGDRIDLRAIDAIAGKGDDPFTLAGAFTHLAGQLVVQFEVDHYLVSGDVNGDGVADFGLNVFADTPLVASDFVL